MFRKAKRFRYQGKRKGCGKVAKKTRKVIAKASACNRGIKDTEKEINNATGISPQAMMGVDKQMAAAKARRDSGNFSACVSKSNRVIQLIEGSA